MVDSKTQVILALDVESRSKAESILEATGDKLQWVKIGLQTYLRDGPAFLRDVAASGKSIFLDLKLNDIPTTCSAAIRSLKDIRNINYITLHANAGEETIKAVVKSAKKNKS